MTENSITAKTSLKFDLKFIYVKTRREMLSDDKENLCLTNVLIVFLLRYKTILLRKSSMKTPCRLGERISPFSLPEHLDAKFNNVNKACTIISYLPFLAAK